MLSLAMIVKNEEAFLGHCLASVRGLVDEMVIVDTGSTDGTVALAREAGARVFHAPWRDDFAAARNEALGHCQGDWILILDADEALDPLDHPKVRAACAQDTVAAFQLTLRNYVLSGNASNLDQAAQVNHSPYQEGSAYGHFADTEAIRLCRNLPGLAFRGRIHELLSPFFLEARLAVGRLDAVVHHYGKTAPDREARKAGYYLELARKEVRAHPGSYQAQFNLVNAALGAGDWTAVTAAGSACRALRPGFAEPLVLLGLGMACQHRGDPAGGLAFLDELLKACPDHAMALTRRGLSLVLLGRAEEAKASLAQATEVTPGFALPWLNLGEIQAQLGEPEAARETFRRGLEAIPGEASLLHARVQVAIQLNRIDLALEDARAALQAQPRGGAGLWHRLVAADLFRQGRAGEARQVLARGLEAFPGDAELTRLLGLVAE
jgi:tetratricopeptide (TPR) repeat protein